MMDKVIIDIEQNNQISEDIKKDLMVIYQKYKTLDDSDKDKKDLKESVDWILEKMFKTSFNYSIPMDFITSPIGRILFEIKLDISNSMMYGFAELMIIADKSKQMIFHDYRNGNLKGIETGKKKRVLVTEDAVVEYITSIGRKPFSPEEAKRRISMFNKMTREGSSEDEIRKILCEMKEKG